MILADSQLFRLGHILVEPFNPDNVQPVSIDLTLGEMYRLPGGPVQQLPYIVEPFTPLVLAATEEKITIPDDKVGVLSGKSTLARQGVTIHQTAGFIDAGFEGQITLEIVNFGREPFTLEAGMLVAQIYFFETCGPVLRPYGTEGLNSHYQNQKGPTDRWTF